MKRQAKLQFKFLSAKENYFYESLKMSENGHVVSSTGTHSSHTAHGKQNNIFHLKLCKYVTHLHYESCLQLALQQEFV